MKLAALAILVVAGLALLARHFAVRWEPRVAYLPTMRHSRAERARLWGVEPLLPPDPAMDRIWAAADYDRTPWSRS